MMQAMALNCRCLSYVLRYSIQNSSRQISTAKVLAMSTKIVKTTVDADTFGSLDTDQHYKSFMEADVNKFMEDEERSPYVRLSTSQRRQKPSYYGKKIQQLAKEGKIREAISVFEDEMLEKDRVKPTPFVFISLITALGRVGYTKKAFSLFNQMKKFGYTPPEATYTALFNSCANSPYPEDGRSRAIKLLHLLKSKGIELNEIQYKAAIKALSICGDHKEAVMLADEAQKRFPLDPQFLSALQMTCISDKQKGLTPALKLWRFMRINNCKPDLYNYNLLLRTLRDCSASPSDILQIGGVTDYPSCGMALTLDDPSRGSVEVHANSMHALNEKPGFIQHQLEGLDSSLSMNTAALEVSRKDSTVGMSVEALDEVLRTPSGRLSLLGGPVPILDNMQADGVTPDVISLSLLLELAPNTSADAECFIMNTADRLRVQLDTDFFNGIIRRRIQRKDDSVKDILELMSKRGLSPGMRTFGELASGCRSRKLGLELLADMENLGVEPSETVLSILLRRSGRNFRYKQELCTMLEELNLQPSMLTLRNLQYDVDRTNKQLTDKRSDTPDTDLNRLQKEYSIFMKFYKPWLKRVQVKLPQHPWKDFRNLKKDQ